MPPVLSQRPYGTKRLFNVLQGLKVPAYSPVAPPGQKQVLSFRSNLRLPLRGKGTLRAPTGQSHKSLPTLRLPRRGRATLPAAALPLWGNRNSTDLRMGVSKRAARPKFGPAPGDVCLIQVPGNSGAATELSIDAKSYESAVG